MGTHGLFGEAVDRIGGEPISSRMARKAPIRHLDPVLLLVTLMLSAYGAVMILSATFGSQQEAGLDPNYYLKRQIFFIVIGMVVLIGISLFDYRYLRGVAPFLYGLTAIALIVVLSPLGEVVQGARRWIDIGFFQVQPSEFTKLAVIVALAAYLAERRMEMRARDVAIACAIVGLPALLIFLEPDVGTMLVVTALLGGILLVAGARLRHFLVLALILALAVVVVLQADLLKDYQKQRLTAFLETDPDPQSYGYNVVQSKIAIGAGGIRGRGLDGDVNTQTQLDFVPEQNTDFIFTAVGEQLGFIGAATLLSMFAFLIWRGLRIAAMSRDLFGTILAGGVVTLWAFQLFVNVGMTMGIMPITGIPLPFISYGGSSLLTNYAAVGLLLNIHMRRFL